MIQVDDLETNSPSLLTTFDTPPDTIGRLRTLKLIHSPFEFKGLTFYYISDELRLMLKGRKRFADTIDSYSGSIQAAIVALIENKNFTAKELDLNAIVLLKYRPRFIFIRKCKFERLKISRPEHNNSLLVFDETFIDILESSDQQFSLRYCLAEHDKLQISAIVHKCSDSAINDQSQTQVEVSAINTKCVYTDARNVFLSEIPHLIALLHPQASEANFLLKNVEFRFDLRALADNLTLKLEQKKISGIKLLFSSPRLQTKPFWEKVDLSLSSNALIAESTIKQVVENSSLLVSSENYNRYLYFLNSRNHPLKRFFYWFNGAYYNIKIPLISAIVSFSFLPLLLYLGGYSISETYFVIDPKALLKEYLFSGFHFSIQAFSLTKYIFVFCLGVFYYSFFCLSLALKRRFGFPNELR